MRIGLIHAFTAMILALSTTLPATAQSFMIDDILYESTDGKNVEITAEFPYSTSGDVTLPSSVTYGGKTYTVTSIGDRAFQNNKNITSIVIPESITKIGSFVFAGCGNMVSAKIPNSVTTLGASVFSQCYKLEKVELGTGINSISMNMFVDCTSMATIDIPDNISSISPGAFARSGLTSFVFPDKITKIDEFTFTGCTNLKSVKIGNGVTIIGEAFSESGLTSIDIPEGVTIIYNSFNNCTDLKYVSLPESLKEIGFNTFYGCTALETIEIPDAVTLLEYNVFTDCANLKTVVLGKNISSIGNETFLGCNKLENVYCKSQTPPTVENTEMLFPENIKNATLYVPQNTKNSYSSTAPWSYFGTIIEQDFEVGIIDVTTESNVSIMADGGTITVSGANAARVEVYTTDGQCVYSGTETTITNLPRGIYIVKAAGQSKKVTL
jgi:hypothetical protein